MKLSCKTLVSKFAIHLEYENYCIFHFVLLYFFPNDCPCLCRHVLGHLLDREKNKVAQKGKKNYTVFHIPKLWQILKVFC